MKKTVVIIGAGPSALVAAKTLLQESSPEIEFDPICLESEDDIGGTFRYRGYENATLVSSKQLTSFSDFRVPMVYHDHFTLPEYVEYLRSYMSHFGVRVKLGCRVTKVSRNAKGIGHIVQFVDKKTPNTTNQIYADYLVVCSGLHVTPAWPEIPGMEYVLKPENGVDDAEKHIIREVYHSSQYKRRSQLAGRRVMVLGTGETGHDLAYEAAKAGATQVTLCTRGGFLSFPKVLNDFEVFGYKFEGNLPIDGLITNLFETTYVHPWIAASHIRWFISDFVIKRLLWFLTGTQAGCNQWVGELDSDRLGRAYVFLNKSNKAMPYINRNWRKRPALLEYMSRYIEPPEDSPPKTHFSVELAPFPSHFLPSGRAQFPVTHRKESKRIQNMDIRPQTVIYATGYTQNFDFLDETYPTTATIDVRNVFSSSDPTVAFIGFVRPGVGAIPPIAEIQSMFWTAVITGKVPVPMDPPHYHLLAKEHARIKYGVDHGAYMSTLARDTGCVPGLWELWREHGTHVLTCYIFGAAFTTFYRLVGPYRSPTAPEIVKTELWETITRRGIFGNLLMGLIPMIGYALMNIGVLLAEMVWVLVGRPGKQRVPRGYFSRE